MFTTIIEVSELSALIENTKDVLIFDCRHDLKDTQKGRADYQQAHIPTAMYLHLDDDLSGPIIAGQTGRHPLPDLEVMQARFSEWGIDEHKQVVVYDDKKGAIAARMWWMLQYAGHTQVAVLNGGWQAWQTANLPTQSGAYTYPASNFELKAQAAWVLDAQAVEVLEYDKQWTIVDSRAYERYLGKVEPIDPIAGHVPGAISFPFANNWAETGLMKTKEEIKRGFEHIQDPEHTVFYCGSGVTACYNILAYKHAGLGMPRLYPGSWSDWIIDENRVHKAKSPKYAVIDCGTNTFHLLITRPNEQGILDDVYRDRRYIKLGEEGIERIGDAAYQRALNTLQDYASTIKKHAITNVRISGTAALRRASNGSDLVAEVKAKTGLEIDTISGDEEAQLIYKGVAQAIGPQDKPWMVMDIGGGSVEFIIVDGDGMQWYKSFPVGVAVLYNNFHHTEPISAVEIEQLNTFLSGQLAELQLALAKYPVRHLVGAAGTFDVIAEVLGCEHKTPYSTEVDIKSLKGFQAFYERLIVANKEERYAMPDVPDARADMIVVALILVKFIIDLAAINELTVSELSLKEGMLAEMLEAKNKEAGA